jgi:hypothetical protein
LYNDHALRAQQKTKNHQEGHEVHEVFLFSSFMSFLVKIIILSYKIKCGEMVSLPLSSQVKKTYG